MVLFASGEAKQRRTIHTVQSKKASLEFSLRSHYLLFTYTTTFIIIPIINMHNVQ